jgi:tetratricopeptide (TPR) repeat protein
VAGTRVALSEDADAELAGELAYVDALLATDYGLTARGEATQALGRARRARGAAAAVARGLLALADGQTDQAAKLAGAALEAHREDPRPLLLLARIRRQAGDWRAASAALEAAMVNAPRATAPLVDWAALRLLLGQPEAAARVLATVVKRAPDHTRAWLLHEEARGVEAAGAREGCARDASVSPAVASWCVLRAATAARLHGRRAEALSQARAAGKAPLAAVILAQLGAVDEAAALLPPAPAPPLSAEGWARAAVALGRGELPDLPAITPSSFELRLLFARAALAAGGPGSLARALATLGPAARERDPDLRALATLVTGDEAPPGPVHAYADGLRARLAGDLEAATGFFAAALEGHGDTCRAAAEYVAALRLLRRPTEGVLAPVQARNAGCLNLGLPPPLRDRRRESRPRRPGPRRSRSSTTCGRARRRARSARWGSNRCP